MAGVMQLTLPLVGRVAAGSPILAAEHIDRQYQVDASVFDEQPDYLLRVRGLSMRDAGIPTATCSQSSAPARPATARSW